MSIRSYKPTTPAQRGMDTQDWSAITTKKPVRSLLTISKKTAGRNNQGRITTRHKGGGAKRFYRKVNFNLAESTSATVEHIEYDPNRTARLARIKDQDGTYHYVLATKEMKQGTKIVSDIEVPIENGNRTSLANLPVGTQVHAIELQPGRGAQLVRSAGTSAQLVAKEGTYAQIKLPSGEVRLVSVNCKASIGSLGNEQHQNISYGKAGRMRHKGIRPTVRGVVMNAADHPHGGGDGGRHRMARAPVTPWGQKTLGYKTRSKRASNKFIVRTRHQAKRK